MTAGGAGGFGDGVAVGVGHVARSDGAQMPAEYSRLVGDDIYLAGQMPVAPAIPVATPSPAPKGKKEWLADAAKYAAEGRAKASKKARPKSGAGT